MIESQAFAKVDSSNREQKVQNSQLTQSVWFTQKVEFLCFSSVSGSSHIGFTSGQVLREARRPGARTDWEAVSDWGEEGDERVRG